MPQLIINADDFGRTQFINEAVGIAWQQGVLTSASLMIAGEAAAGAVALAKENPGLEVGLHLTLSQGQPVLPIDQVAHLVDPSTGRFFDNPTKAGWNLFWNRAARREAAAEISAQFESFAATELPLSHVDGHQHLHLHPVAFDLLMPLLERFNAGGIRLPLDFIERPINVRQATEAFVLTRLARRARRRMGSMKSLIIPARSIGFIHSGAMNEQRVINVINNLAKSESTDCVEMYFHPTTGPRIDALGPNDSDLQALLSQRVRQAITTAGLQPTNYRDAAHTGAPCGQDVQLFQKPFGTDAAVTSL